MGVEYTFSPPECFAEKSFGRSQKLRYPRPSTVRFRIGQTVKHTTLGYTGVIIGWDAKATAPKIWLQANMPKKKWRSMPCYAVLISTHADMSAYKGITMYLAERHLVLTQTQIESTCLESYCKRYDHESGQYIMSQTLRDRYPED